MLLFYSIFLVLGIGGILANTTFMIAISKIKLFHKKKWLILSAALMSANLILSIGFTIPAVITIDQFALIISLNQ